MSQPTQLNSVSPQQSLYDQTFFDLLLEGAERSARQIVPIILEWLQPQSVVDVGCGLGAWLSVFQELGVQEYLGVDGNHVDVNKLKIPRSNFSGHDLTHPFNLNRRFDLAISLEVAEHLPESSARAFIESLVLLADVVLFSAAIPFQGGTGHVNEQWSRYWVQIFEQYNYVEIDCLRRRIWHNKQVEPWYIQNSLLFIKADKICAYPHLPETQLGGEKFPSGAIHPQIYQNSLSYYVEPLKTKLTQIDSELKLAQSELKITQKLLEDANTEIAAIKSSKLWQLKKYWLGLKEYILN